MGNEEKKIKNPCSSRWPLAAFFSLLEITCWNSFVIARDIGITHSNRRDFLIQLGELLCTAERHKQAAENHKQLYHNSHDRLPQVEE